MGLRLTSLSVPPLDWAWLTLVDTEQESFADVSVLQPRCGINVRGINKVESR